MIVYCVKVSINRDIEEKWFQWMRSAHIPDVMATGLFQDYEILKQVDVSEDQQPTYQIRYFCESMDQLQQYQQQFAAALQADHTQRYAGKFQASRKIFETLI